MIDDLGSHLTLIAVTDDQVLAGRDLIEACEAAVRGGASMVQLRLKRALPRELARLATALIERLPVPVIVNDRVDVALGVGAAGVHLGADDLPVARVRAAVSRDLILGASVGDSREADAARAADYWGLGPWRVSPTKADAGAPLREADSAELARRGRGKPWVAIGGVVPNDIPAVVRAGGAGVAVVSGIFGAPDIEAAAREYRRAWLGAVSPRGGSAR